MVTHQKKANKVSRKQHTNLGKGVELLNREEDESEQNNRAKKYPEMVKQLTAIYTNWKKMVTKGNS